MSVILKNTTSLNVIFQNSVKQLNCTQMRFAKSPGQSQGGSKRKRIVYSLLKNPGDRVDERMLIGTQKRLNYHPGLNVGVNPLDKSLYAICAGTIYYSIEKFNPNMDNPLVQQFYSNELRPYYKKYIHVIPDKTTNEFRLIDIV